MKKFIAAILFIGAVFTIMYMHTAQQQLPGEPPPRIPVPGMITMLNIGTDNCRPCIMMQPILDELSEVYEDQAVLAFIDIRRFPEHGQRFEILTIPTQIFFDHQGREHFRHQGFMDRESIVEVLEELLHKQNVVASRLQLPDA